MLTFTSTLKKHVNKFINLRCITLLRMADKSKFLMLVRFHLMTEMLRVLICRPVASFPSRVYRNFSCKLQFFFLS